MLIGVIFRLKVIIVIIIILWVKSRYIESSISSKDLANNLSKIVVMISIGATKDKVLANCSNCSRIMYLTKKLE